MWICYENSIVKRWLGIKDYTYIKDRNVCIFDPLVFTQGWLFKTTMSLSWASHIDMLVGMSCVTKNTIFFFFKKWKKKRADFSLYSSCKTWEIGEMKMETKKLLEKKKIKKIFIGFLKKNSGKKKRIIIE